MNTLSASSYPIQLQDFSEKGKFYLPSWMESGRFVCRLSAKKMKSEEMNLASFKCVE